MSYSLKYNIADENIIRAIFPESSGCDVTIRIQGKNPRIINNSAEQRLAEKGAGSGDQWG